MLCCIIKLSSCISEYQFIKSSRGGVLLMLDGYTFAKNAKHSYYCSKKSIGCRARVRLDHNMRLVNIEEIVHNHVRPTYMVTKNGEYIKVSS